MICGSLRWLEDSEQRDREAVERALSGTTSCGAPDTGKEDGDNGTFIYLHPVAFLLGVPAKYHCYTSKSYRATCTCMCIIHVCVLEPVDVHVAIHMHSVSDHTVPDWLRDYDSQRLQREAQHKLKVRRQCYVHCRHYPLHVHM